MFRIGSALLHMYAFWNVAVTAALGLWTGDVMSYECQNRNLLRLILSMPVGSQFYKL